jgi:hypothetical protein
MGLGTASIGDTPEAIDRYVPMTCAPRWAGGELGVSRISRIGHSEIL